MNWKKITILLLVLLIADQALKIWVKTSMHLDESIMVIPDWFRLHFVENNGAAFGMQLSLAISSFAFSNQGALIGASFY